MDHTIAHLQLLRQGDGKWGLAHEEREEELSRSPYPSDAEYRIDRDLFRLKLEEHHIQNGDQNLSWERIDHMLEDFRDLLEQKYRDHGEATRRAAYVAANYFDIEA
ncbi:hypothetical protein [Dongshaea marina]|uniref:hypothetical protein n=1 Tax=Dongshaea marina TaxID=2047966 RepID=UPI000D3EAA9D|nr:hypothetical protein [Dongshaea marina]